MRKQDRIISLIQSLSQGEKKYFVQRSRAGFKNKSYLKLYELLLTKESYNPDELCRQLKKDKAGLANEKKYLEKQLLSALREYHEAHPHVASLNLIAEGVLLMERNLYEPAQAVLQSSIRHSSTSGLLPLQWHANGLMLTLCGHPFTAAQHTKKVAEHHLQQLQNIAAQITLYTDFEWLNHEVFEAYQKRKVDITDKHRSETLKLLQHKLLASNYDYYLFASYKFSLQSLLYTRMGNLTANIDANRKLMALLESQKKIDAIAYWSSIANLTQSIITGGNKQEYDLWMEQLQNRYYKKLPVDASYIDQMLAKHKNIFHSGVLFYQLFKKEVPTVEIQNLIRKFSRHVKKEKENTPAFHFASTLYKIAACALVIGNPSDCIDLLNILLNDTETTINAIAHKNARLLFIMAHIQKQNYLLLPSLINSTLHQLKKTNEDYTSELLLLKQFEEAAKINSSKTHKSWLTDFKKAIKEMEQNAANKKLLNMIPVWAWAAGKY